MRWWRWQAGATLCAGAALVFATHAHAQETPAVTVTAARDTVVNKVDKTVVDVANLVRAANGTAQDVLQSTPGVSVAADGQIAVKGNAQVTVLVDGKPTAMLSGSDRAVALQTMSGADIASIEVITNPSAAYNANGGAILNIVLKRNRKPGAHGQLQASATDQGLWNAGAAGDATGQDLSVHGSLALRHDGNEKLRASAVDWFDPSSGRAGQTTQASRVFVRRVVATGALGVDYALGEFDSISLATRYNRRRSRPLFDVLNDDVVGTDATRYHRISYGPNEQSDASASLSYSHQDHGTAFKAMLEHSATDMLVDKSYRDVYVTPAFDTVASHGATRAERRLNQATLDWSRPSEHGQWGAGIDLQDRVDDVANYQASIDPATLAETVAPDTTNRYAVQTTMAAAYLTDQIRAGKWEVLLGGRAERTQLAIDPFAGVLPARHWQAVNPSVNLTYAATDQTDLTFSYRRSLQMPDPRDLNPYTTYVDAQNLSRGNPLLQPQHLTSWESGLNTDFAHARASLGLFYRTSSDTVVDARSIDAANVLVTSKQNGGQARSLGVTGSVDWTVNAHVKLGVDTGLYRVQLATLDIDRLVRQSGTAAYANLRAAYSAGAYDLAVDAHGQSAGITPLGRFGVTSSVNVAWRHQLNKTLSLTVNGNDLFDGSRRTYSTDTSTFRQTGYDHFVARRIYVGLVNKLD